MHSTYGFDVIAMIGWHRRRLHQTYAEIHRGLRDRLQISEAQVHTRSVKQAQRQLQKLKERWFQLPPD